MGYYLAIVIIIFSLIGVAVGANVEKVTALLNAKCSADLKGETQYASMLHDERDAYEQQDAALAVQRDQLKQQVQDMGKQIEQLEKQVKLKIQPVPTPTPKPAQKRVEG